MGKKPVVGLIGLVWAGIALTGCGECCRNNNTRNTYNPRPLVQTKEVAGPKGPVSDAKAVGMDLPPAKPPEAGGATPVGDFRKAAGPGAAPVSSPGPSDKVNSLRPASDATDLRPVGFRRTRETGAGPEPLAEPTRQITHMPPLPMPSERKVERAPAPSGDPRPVRPSPSDAPPPPAPHDLPQVQGAPPPPLGAGGS